MKAKVQKPKIVFLTCALSGGGAERSLLAVFKSVDRRRFAPEIWRLEPLNMYPQCLSRRDVAVVLPQLGKSSAEKARIKRYSSRLPLYLKRSNGKELITDSLRVYDQYTRVAKRATTPILFVSSQFSMNIRAALFQQLCQYRVPVIFTEHNEPYCRYELFEKQTTRDWAWASIRRLYPRATHVVTVSKAVRQSLISKFGLKNSRVSTIYNSIDAANLETFWKHPAPIHRFYRGRAPVLVCASRFHRLKNHQMLLRSFASAIKVRPAKLILIGQGELKNEIRRIIFEMGLREHVAIVGFKPDPFHYIAHADLTVIPSYCEGHPLQAMESLALGVPVVSTNWKGVGEIIRHGRNGIVCKMNDAALAASIIAGLRLKKSKAARSAWISSLDQFAPDRIMHQHETLFTRLIDRWLKHRK